MEIMTLIMTLQKETLKQNFLYWSFFRCFCKSWAKGSYHSILCQKHGFRSDVWLPSWPKLECEAKTFFKKCKKSFVTYLHKCQHWMDFQGPSRRLTPKELVSLVLSCFISLVIVKSTSLKKSVWTLFNFTIPEGGMI